MSIKVIDLNYTYGAGTAFEQHALKHVNFEINDGEFVGLIGHTGSGKSTLIQHLNGLIRPTGGDILYHGTSILYFSTRSISFLKLMYFPMSALDRRTWAVLRKRPRRGRAMPWIWWRGCPDYIS